MKIDWPNKYHIFFSLIISSSFSLKAPPRNQNDLIHQKIISLKRKQLSIKKKLKQIRKEQNSFIEILKKSDHKKLDPSDMLHFVKVLKGTKDYKEITPFYETLKFATHIIYNAENFTLIIKKIINFLYNKNIPALHGHLYEIEKATAIMEKDIDEEVIAFSKKIPNPNNKKELREFDVVTNKRWIECKNVTWKSQGKKQFLDQKRIVDAYNKKNKTNIKFEVHSKRAMPAKWQQWFAGNNIPVCIDNPNIT